MTKIKRLFVTIVGFIKADDEEALIKDLENGLLEESEDDAQMQEDGGN